MKVLQINSVHYGSTGNIMRGIDALASMQGFDSYIAFPDGRHNHLEKAENHIYIGGRFSEDFHLLMDRLTGLNGCFSKIATKHFIRKIEELKPDIIHMHNLHNCYINLKMLFDYLKRSGIPVIWTLHDCWSMTGHCPHFMYPACDKWKTGCYDCIRYRDYPQSFVDTSKRIWNMKKECFTGVQNLTIVTPSEWLSGVVKESYLNSYETRVISNGIETNVFQPKESRFREEYRLEDKKLVLCVSDDWGVKSKGLETVNALSGVLPDEYRIILVGTVPAAETVASGNIVYIGHTDSKERLAEIYTAADVLFNPTREDVFGLVNAEALSCGTPVVVRRTGGCPEIVDGSCGFVYDTDDVEEIRDILIQTVERKPELADACRNRASMFDKKKTLQKYVDLYREKING